MEKIISEKTPIFDASDYSQDPSLLSFPEIEKLLEDGWCVKQMFVNTYGEKAGVPLFLILTVHLQKP